MANLKQLFDMQKIVENEGLTSIIGEAHSRYSNIVELNDDMLELATAGIKGNSNDDDLVRVSCSFCNNIFKASKSKKSIVCPSCGKVIDINIYSN